MSVAIALYSVLVVAGSVVVLAAVAQYGRDQWHHRTEDGERLAARFTAPTGGGVDQETARGAVATHTRRMHVDLGVALAGYGCAFVGDVAARGLIDGWHPAGSAWWALIDAFIATAVHVLLDRNTAEAWRGRPVLRNGTLLMALALVLGVVGGAAGV